MVLLEQEEKTQTSGDAPLIHMEELSIKRGSAPDPALSLGERIQNGKSVLLLHNLMTPEEIEFVAETSLAAAAASETATNSDGLDNGVPGNAYIRMSTLAAAQRENRNDALPEATSQLLETILERALCFMDQRLCASIQTTLFGEDTDSIAELFRRDQLEFSIREPAVNIYTAPHGHFGMHTRTTTI